MANKYDWEAIEREYRAGVLSIREIAKIHGCSDGAIRKKAKQFGWERNLSRKIEEKVRTELVRTEVRTANPTTEKEIIEQAAATQVEVVRSHRKKIKRAHEIVTNLFEQLASEAVKKRGKNSKFVPANATAAGQLINGLKTLVALDRQAFSIGDNAGEGDKFKESIKKMFEEIGDGGLELPNGR